MLRRPVTGLSHRLAGGAAVLLAFVAVSPAAAQGDTPPAVARLQVRVSALEEDLRNATGQVERLRFEVRKLEKQLATATADMESRIEALEGGQGSAPATAAPGMPSPAAGATPAPGNPPRAATSQTTPNVSEAQRTAALPPPPARGGAPRTTTPPAARPAAVTLPPGTPEQQYAFAFELLREQDWPRSEAAFRAFIDQHPEAKLADNARYWLAETYYVRGNFDAAASAFSVAYQSNPEGAKAADALLKLGMSLGKLNRKDDACLVFQQIKGLSPKVAPRILRLEETEAQRLGCP